MSNIDYNLITAVAAIAGSLGNFIVAFFTFKAAKASKESIEISKIQIENNFKHQFPYIVLNRVFYDNGRWYANIVNASEHPVIYTEMKFKIDSKFRKSLLPFLNDNMEERSFLVKDERDIIYSKDIVTIDITKLINVFIELQKSQSPTENLEPLKLTTIFKGKYIDGRELKPIEKEINFRINEIDKSIEIKPTIINSNEREI